MDMAQSHYLDSTCLPPNIFVELQFVDDNANGLLEAEENARLILKIRNEGNGPAP